MDDDIFPVRRPGAGTVEAREKKSRQFSPSNAASLSPAARKRQIWFIYFIGFMDLFSISMMIPLYPRLTRLLGASPSLAGLIGSLYGVVQVFSSPIVGKLSDVYGRKNLLYLSYLVPALGYLMLAMAASYQSLPLLILSRLPTGVFKHGLSVGKAYLTDITEVADRQSVLGLFNACSSMGFIFGPLIGGYLADFDNSLQLCMLCGAAIFIVNVLCIWLLVQPIPPAKVSTQNEGISNLRETLTFKHFLASINIFKGLRWWDTRDIITLRFVITFCVIMFRSNLTIFLQEHFDVDYKTLGKIISFNGVVAAIAGATCGYVSRFYSNQTKQVTHFLILLGVAILGATCAPSLLTFILMIIPLSIATSNLRICTLSLFLSRVPEEEKGAVIGLGYSISSVSRMLSPSFVGLAQEYNSELAGYVSAGLAGMAALIMLLAFPLVGPATGGRKESSSEDESSSNSGMNLHSKEHAD